MALTLTLTRRAAVICGATVLAVGGAVVVGLVGSSSTPQASAATYSGMLPTLDPSATAVQGGAFPGITVDGVGKVTGTPDTLILSITVDKTASDVSTAMTQLAGTMTGVQQSLTAHGVKDADMKTSNLGVNPTYDYSNNKQTLTGYEATESLTVQLRDIKGAGAAISAATDAGGNSTRISGLSTDLQNDSALLNTARDAAFADAKAKATQYAKSAGRTLGPVVRIEEAVNTTSPQPVYDGKYMAAAPAASNAAPVPVQVGSTDLTVTVSVVFSFA